MYFVYFLLSYDNNHWYVGCSTDLEKRLKQHNQGNTKSTKPYRPWRVVYCEKYQNKNNAYKREYFLKSPNGYLESRNIKEKILSRGEVA